MLSSKVTYNCFKKFIFRTPTYSIDNYLSHKNPILQEEVVLDRIFLESIFLASPELYEAIESYRQNKLSKKQITKLNFSLLKYFTRMSTRCTPFGLFAGTGFGIIENDLEILLPTLNGYRTKTRLDMDFMCALLQSIANSDFIKDQVKYYLNSSIFLLGNKLRYTEYNYQNKKRKYLLSSVEVTPYLERIIKVAREGTTINELIILIKEDSISEEEAKDYIYELIKYQILVSELLPSVTGDELLNKLCIQIGDLHKTEELLLILKQIVKKFSDLDFQPIGRDINIYFNIKTLLKGFEIEFEEKFLFQTDLLVIPEKASISNDLVNNVMNGLKALNKLTRVTTNPHLDKFKEEFYMRYEEEEIPLLEALDLDTGIGFGNTSWQSGDINQLVDDIILGNQNRNHLKILLDKIQLFLINKYEDFISNPKTNEIEIHDSELDSLSDNWDDLPDTFQAIVEVLDIHDFKNPLLFINSASGSSGVNLIGRFCHLSTDIFSLAVDIVKKEEELNKDILLAEIVHLPESRIGNVLFHPALRGYEIPFLANPSYRNSEVIPLSDILVSVPNQKRIKLISKRYKKEIIPRLSNAHNFSQNSLPTYHFLAALQTQNKRVGLIFQWGEYFGTKLYLPRVKYKNIILSPALWRISKKEILAIPPISDNNFINEVLKFWKERSLPDQVLFGDYDNKLLIDINNPSSIQLLFSEVQKKEIFVLEEFLFKRSYMNLISNGEEVFTNQIILFFYKSMIEDADRK